MKRLDRSLDGLQALPVGLRCRKLWAQKAQQTALGVSQVNTAVGPKLPSVSAKLPPPVFDETFPGVAVLPMPAPPLAAAEPLRSFTM